MKHPAGWPISSPSYELSSFGGKGYLGISKNIEFRVKMKGPGRVKEKTDVDPYLE